MNFEEKDLERIMNDVELLTHEEMHEVIGGDTPPCAGCCALYNGGVNNE